MSFLRRNKDKEAKPQATPMIDPDTGLPPVYEPPDPNAADEGPKGNIFQRLIQYIKDSYNGLYKIVLEPSMPTRQSVLLIVLGIIIGIIWGWLLSPVVYYDGGPHQLANAAQDQWVRMIAGSYEAGMYNDADAQSLLAEVERPGVVAARLLNSAPDGTVEKAALTNIQPIAQGADPASTPSPTPGDIVGSIVSFLIPIIVVIIVAPILVVVWRLLIYPNIVANIIAWIQERRDPELASKRQKERDSLKALQERKRMQEEMQANVVDDVEFGAPVMQKLSIYTKGRDYDDSFAIELGDDQNNQFLGECGAAIASKAGDAMQTLEFWGFDMATQQTLTKIFVAEGSINDPAVRAKVENRVENPATDLVAATTGAVLNLDTDVLRIQAKIAEVSSGSEGGTPDSSFENLRLEITAWQKDASGVPSGPPPIPAAPPLPDYGTPVQATTPSVPASPPLQPMQQPAEPPSLQPLQPPPLQPLQPQQPLQQPLLQQPQQPTEPPSLQPLQPPPLQPLQPPPLQPQQPLQPLQPPPLQPPSTDMDDSEDDDPFGGTGDFTPLRG